MSQSFDLVVTGAGPAGLAAACIAAEQGMRVALLDDNSAPGGQIWRGRLPKQTPASQQQASWLLRLATCRLVTRFFNCRVFDAPAPNKLFAEQDGRCIEFDCQQLIVSTGARERFLPFPGWTLPNVLGAGALQILVKTGLPIRGKRVVIAGSGPLLLAVAATLRMYGADVLAICEQAPWHAVARFALGLPSMPSKLREALQYGRQILGVPLHFGCWPVAASGKDRLQSIRLSNGRKESELSCDYLACGFHLVPNIELPMLLGCRIEEGAVLVDRLQRTSVPWVYCAGETTGIGGVELALLEGRIAGLAAAGQLDAAEKLGARRNRLQRFARRMAAAFALRQELKSLPQADTILCRCEEVPFSAVAAHSSWRSAKLHTRCGMGTCQGRICGAALQFLMDWQTGSVRPPLVPVTLSSLAAGEPELSSTHLEVQKTV